MDDTVGRRTVRLVRRWGALLVPVVVVLSMSPASAEDPVMHDAMGPLLDVTETWERYQPADEACVTMDGFDGWTWYSNDPGPTCEDGGFHLTVETPELCDGCRRLFIDYAQIPQNDPGTGMFYAHGHVFFRLHAVNPGYTADPVAHSPNIKNFTNDKFIAPEGSTQEQVASTFDTHAIAYVGSTARHTHSEVQGPYYIGPTYLSRAGEWIRGAYVDLDPGATSMGDAALDEIRYWVGFNSGEATCPDNLSEQYADGNYGYAGCANHPAISATAVNPFA